MSAELDIAYLRQWIGRTETRADFVSPQLAAAFCATVLDREQAFAAGDRAPPGLHWCLAQPVFPNSSLGADGHPARGGFLPPLPLPRRMWAGSRVEFAEPLRVGDPVERTSVVKDIQPKVGASGQLCFVAVKHVYRTPTGIAVRETQDLVYREAAPKAGQPRTDADKDAAEAPPPSTPDLTRHIEVSPVLLFRFSALTFNGHRIHYDRRYATEVENYPGLVVHGPLQAALLLNLAAEARGDVPPREFQFRALRPLVDGERITMNGRWATSDQITLWTGAAETTAFVSAIAAW